MRSSAFALALFAAACGPGLNDLGIDAAPITTIKARFDDSALRAGGFEGDLFYGLYWARAPEVPKLCLDYGDVPEVAALCPNPFAVNFAELPSLWPVPASSSGELEIVLEHLPPASVSVGTSGGRVSYGTVIIGGDVNGDGKFNPYLDEGGGVDLLLGASFSSLLAPQDRLVFREGAWNPYSFFFPPLGCDAPPLGFSRMLATLDLSGEKPTGECEITGIDEPLVVAPIAPESAKAMLCGSWVETANPAAFVPQPDMEGVCVSEELYIATWKRDVCSHSAVVALKGCWGDPFCEEPQWDLTNNPPDWWSCK